jgi:hypothetical protein
VEGTNFGIGPSRLQAVVLLVMTAWFGYWLRGPLAA